MHVMLLISVGIVAVAAAAAAALSLLNSAGLIEDGQLELLARSEAPYRFAGPGAADLARQINRRIEAR